MNKILYSFLITICLSMVLSAQNTTKKWYINVGTFAVDHTSVRGVFDGFFDTQDWSATPFGKLTIGRSLNRSFALDLQGSMGEIDNNRLTTFKDEFLTLVSLGLKYKFANGYILKEESWFDPYIRIGAGYHSLDYDNYTFNGVVDSNNDALWGGQSVNRDNFVLQAGAGINFWITKKFGINIESQYNMMPKVKNDYIDFFQHSAGLAFLIGPDYVKPIEECKDTDGDTLCDEDDDCPTIPGPVENKGCPWPDTDGDKWLDKDELCDLDPCPDGVSTDEYYCVKGCKVMKEKPKPPVKPEPPKVIVFEDFLFDFDKADLRPEAEPKLLEAYNTIKENPEKTYIIVGHTDSYGSDSYNDKLGSRRANAVLNALIKKGIDAKNITVKSAGETEPKCTNDTSEGRQCNRRVEIKID